MNKILLYGNQYKTAKIYAHELGNRLAIEALPYNEVKDLENYQTVIHMGGVLEEGVDGLKNTLYKANKDSRLIIVTVGLADVDNKKSLDALRALIKKQISAEDYKRAKIFHVKGGLGLEQMNFFQKFMMKMIYNKVKKGPKENLTDEMKAFIQSYEEREDFIDFTALDPIGDYLNNKGSL